MLAGRWFSETKGMLCGQRLTSVIGDDSRSVCRDIRAVEDDLAIRTVGPC